MFNRKPGLKQCFENTVFEKKKHSSLDYNSARQIKSRRSGECADNVGDTEFSAPEVLNFDSVVPNTDIWSLATLAVTLACGTSPFYYEDENLVIQASQKATYKMDNLETSYEFKSFIKKCLMRAPESRMSAARCLEHEWLSAGMEATRKNTVLTCQDDLRATDDRLLGEEEEEYLEASFVFRTFEEEEYESPDESGSED